MSQNNKSLTIGIVAGEHSGDILGASLIKAIKEIAPDTRFIGVAGPLMREQGCEPLFEMEELAVMGLVEILGKLRRLFQIRGELVQYFTQNPPDVFVGIDAPDFNIGLELKLKAQDIKTVHYVSPSVWAWRKKRIFKIKKATDLVLALLPFEKAFYDQHDAPCTFVGHTLADELPLDIDQIEARRGLGLALEKPVLGVLPGSRGAEVGLLSPPFLQACVQLKQQIPELQIVLPMVNEKRRSQFETIKQEVAPELPVTLLEGQSRDVMSASTAVLLSSGTATLECMLLKAPMVVAYKFKWLSYQIFNRLINVKYFSLPNLLADKPLVAELLQDEVTPENLVKELLPLLTGDDRGLRDTFRTIHQNIRCNASEQAAKAILEVCHRG